MKNKNVVNRLDFWRDPSTEVRIELDHWEIIALIDQQYIKRPRSIRLVWNYLLHVGVTAVIRKIISRTAEDSRNRKVAAVGSGIVLEAPEQSSIKTGEYVLFFATNHSCNPNVICVDKNFVLPFPSKESYIIKPNTALELPEKLKPYIGWSKMSGTEPDVKAIKYGLDELAALFIKSDKVLNTAVDKIEVVERINKKEARKDKPNAVLFGLGNYAKTQIVPHIKSKLHLQCVHEVDPDQLKIASSWGVDLDTAPVPRDEERYDAWFIAGYHHTHAPLAIKALKNGAYAVVEKPLVTNWEQFMQLKNELGQLEKKHLFACFHKRYSILTEWAKKDLNIDAGEPVDMYCSVYEIPLPRLHWYNWPNSGSRIISNGCHWIDYFLYFNDYLPAVKAELWQIEKERLALFVTLENGASLVMSLTERGSARLGVRDIIELRFADVTVRMIDGAYYEAENTRHFIRKKKINPMDAYARMYKQICSSILAGEPGDGLEMLYSSELMLKLEDQCQEKIMSIK